MRVVTDTVFIPFLCKQVMVTPTVDMQCIVCMEGDEVVAGVVYYGYNTVSIKMHTWIDSGRKVSRDWSAATMDYPFNKLGVHKVIGYVAESNEDAARLNKNLGCVIEAVIEDYSPQGALHIYTMTRAQCRILNNPLWAKVVERVAAC